MPRPACLLRPVEWPAGVLRALVRRAGPSPDRPEPARLSISTIAVPLMCHYLGSPAVLHGYSSSAQHMARAGHLLDGPPRPVVLWRLSAAYAGPLGQRRTLLPVASPTSTHLPTASSTR